MERRDRGKRQSVSDCLNINKTLRVRKACKHEGSRNQSRCLYEGKQDSVLGTLASSIPNDLNGTHITTVLQPEITVKKVTIRVDKIMHRFSAINYFKTKY